MNSSSINNKNNKKYQYPRISPNFLLFGGLAAGIISCSSLWLAFKLVQRNNALSNALVSYLNELAKNKPNNPIFLFLLNHNSSLINYVYAKVSLAITILCVIVGVGAFLLAFKLYLDHRNCQAIGGGCQKQAQEKRLYIDYKLNTIALFMALFSTFIILALIIAIPLLLITPDKLADYLCTALDKGGLRNNALLEVLKKIIQSTFQEETIFIDFKYNTKKLLMIFTTGNINLLAIFVVVLCIYCKYYLDQAPEEPKVNGDPELQTPLPPEHNSDSPKGLEQVNVTNVIIPIPVL